MFIVVVSYGCPSSKYPNNGIFQFDQAKALSNAGHHVVYAAIDLRSVRRWRKWGIEKFIKEGIEVYCFNFPLGPIQNCLLNFIGKIGFNFIYKKINKNYGKPDIVHAHFGDTAAYAANFCKKRNIPFVITEHSSSVNKSILSKKEKKHIKKIYSAADRVIVVSKNLGENLYNNIGIRTKCIHNIVDTSIFTYKANINFNSFRFVSVGNLNEGKGFRLLINAFSELLKKYNNCFLSIYGEGPERSILEKQIKNLSIENYVKLYGLVNRTKIAEGFNNSSAFVLASKSETFGVVYIEAMASGLPVIATKCGGPEDFVIPETGLLIQKENLNSLKNAMIYMIENYEKYDRKFISEYAKSNFSSEKISGDLNEVFQEVLNLYDK